MFQVNDLVVYRRRVCRVVEKKKSDFTGEMCYVLVPYEDTGSSVTMQVPISNKAGRLRALVTEEEIRQLIQEAGGLDTLESKPANMKSQYATLMKGNDIRDLIRIIKTSYIRNHERAQNHKKLASIDSEYLEKAENLLFTELSVVLKKPVAECKEYFDQEVEKAAKPAKQTRTSKKKKSE